MEYRSLDNNPAYTWHGYASGVTVCFACLSGDLGLPPPSMPPDMLPPSNGYRDDTRSRPPSAGFGSDAKQFHAGSRVLYNRDQVPVKGTVAKMTGTHFFCVLPCTF